jgi:hypothetical protein
MTEVTSVRTATKMNEQELEQVHKSLMQNGATRALKIAGRLGKKVLNSPARESTVDFTDPPTKP